MTALCYLHRLAWSRNFIRTILELVDKAFKETFQIDSCAGIKEFKTGVYILELFHGPTWAFKDYALKVIGEIQQFYLQKKNLHQIAVVGKKWTCHVSWSENCTVIAKILPFVYHTYDCYDHCDCTIRLPYLRWLPIPYHYHTIWAQLLTLANH